jgi:hypothetical protein
MRFLATPMLSRDPIFIGGMFKSGTSLLRAMLGRHSRLFAGLETQWLNERWDADPDSRSRWFERMSAFFEVPLADLEKACKGAVTIETNLDRLMACLVARHKKARWIEKTPGNAGAIDRILALWPDASILHIIRDPRDVYGSMIESRKWTAPEDFAARWIGTVAAARDWRKAHGGSHPAYYELRYERLVLDPDGETRRVLAFLGELFESVVAEFPGQGEDFERVRRMTGKESPTLYRLAKPISTERIGVWRSVVPAEMWELVYAEFVRSGHSELIDSLIVETENICLNTGSRRINTGQ